MITVSRLMKKYPRPTNEPITTGYCVGGAVCLEFEGLSLHSDNMNKRFPTDAHLGYVLAAITGAEKDTDEYDLCFAFAREVIDHNEAGRFDWAWDALMEVLPW